MDINGLLESPMFQLGMNLLGNMQWSDRPQSLAGNIGQVLQQTMAQQRQKKLLEQEIKDRELRLKAQEQREREFDYKVQKYESEVDRQARIEANRQKMLEPLQGVTDPQAWQNAAITAAQNGDMGFAGSLLTQSRALAEQQQPPKPTQWQTELALEQAIANGTATEEQKRLWDLRKRSAPQQEQKWQYERGAFGALSAGTATDEQKAYISAAYPQWWLEYQARTEEKAAEQPAPAQTQPEGESWLSWFQNTMKGGDSAPAAPAPAPAPSANALPDSVWELPSGTGWEDVYHTAEKHKMTVEQVLSRIGAKRKGQKSGVSGAW